MALPILAAPGAEDLLQTDSRPGLALRQQAAWRLTEVLDGADFAPFSAIEISEGRDRALANRLVTTALRRHGHINAAMGRLLDRGPPKRAGSFEAHLRLGLAQLLYLPEQGAHSAVHLAVEAVKRDNRAARYAGLMNAALRRAQAEVGALRALPVEMLLPRALQKRWAHKYGPEAIASATHNLLSGAALDLTLRDDDPDLIAALGARRLHEDTVRIDDLDRPVSELTGYAEGRWWVQDLAAAIPARLLQATTGARVVDLCAAPGGKTAQLIKAGYQVTAVDANVQRLERLRGNLERLGFGAEVVSGDATVWRPDAPVDGVLLDAPCSATGTFRRHPEVLWRRDAGRVADRVALQRRMLANAAACLGPAGALIYCVCSLEPEEGEAQVRWATETLDELAFSPIARAELGVLGAAVTDAGVVRTHPALTVAGDKRGSLDGFFVARFTRR